MKNQVVLMKRKGINAAFIGEEQQDHQVINTIRAGHIPLVVQRLYCQLAGGVCLTMLASEIWTVANDEAICISLHLL